MKYLLSMALLLLAPQNQQLPDTFHQLPEQDREKATLIIAGTYGEGRSPCIFMPDGSRRWALVSWFQVAKVYRGKVGGKAGDKYIYINSATLPKTEDVREKLVVGHKYLVLLRPGDESMKRIEAGGHVPFWEALSDEEIITIVELK